MMDPAIEQETGTQEQIFYGNTPKDVLDDGRAFYDVLKRMGFDITYQEEGAKDLNGVPLPTHYRVFVNSSDVPKIAAISRLFLPTSEAKLISSATIGDPDALIDAFQVKKSIQVYDKNTRQFRDQGIEQWVGENSELIRRALKLAFLRKAELHEGWAKAAEEDRGYGVPSRHIAEAKMRRQSAELLEKRELDPEGLRIVIHQKVGQILEQHPDLKPASKL